MEQTQSTPEQTIAERVVADIEADPHEDKGDWVTHADNYPIDYDRMPEHWTDRFIFDDGSGLIARYGMPKFEAVGADEVTDWIDCDEGE